MKLLIYYNTPDHHSERQEAAKKILADTVGSTDYIYHYNHHHQCHVMMWPDLLISDVSLGLDSLECSISHLPASELNMALGKGSYITILPELSYAVVLQSVLDSLLPRPTTAMSTYYVCTFLLLYKYYMDIGVDISDNDTRMVMHTLVNFASIENSLHSITQIMDPHMSCYPGYVTHFNGRTDYHGSLMVMESIMLSLEKTQTSTCRNSMFNFTKGLSLSMMANTVAQDASSHSMATMIAHILRLHYTSTVRDGSQYQVYRYTHRWSHIKSWYQLTCSIASCISFYNNYATSDVSTLVGVEGTNKLFELLGKRNLSDWFVKQVVTALSIDNLELGMLTYHHKLMFTDGVYDLVTNQFRDRFPHDMAVFTLNYPIADTLDGSDYEGEALLDELMNSFFRHQNVIDYMYHIFASCLKGDVSDKSFWMFLGDTHAGKSKFMDLVKHAFHDYAVILQGGFFNHRSAGNSSATPELTKTIGKLVGIVQEPKRGVVDVEAIKELTGDTEINYRKLFCEAGTTKTTIRLFACANDVMLNTSDPAFWDRCKVVMFNRVFLPQDEYHKRVSKLVVHDDRYMIRDLRINQKIRRVAGVFMRRLISTYQTSKDQGIHHPEIISKYTNMLRLRCDNILKYINEMFVQVDDVTSGILLTDAYTIYNTWYKNIVADNKNYMTLNRFMDLIKSNGLEIVSNIIIRVVLAPKATSFFVTVKTKSPLRLTEPSI